MEFIKEIKRWFKIKSLENNFQILGEKKRFWASNYVASNNQKDLENAKEYNQMQDDIIERIIKIKQGIND